MASTNHEGIGKTLDLLNDTRVQFELTRYLTDNWVPVIETDVDGPGSLPLRMDSDVPNLGKFSACRRVARTVYLGSAPLTQAAHRGLEERRVKLGGVRDAENRRGQRRHRPHPGDLPMVAGPRAGKAGQRDRVASPQAHRPGCPGGAREQEAAE